MPARREATFGHITTPSELSNTPSVPSLAIWRGSGGVPKKGYPRCESVEKKKTASIGRSPWNTLGGNSENFIRPQTRHRGCTLYSQRSVGGRERCAERISVSRMAEQQSKVTISAARLSVSVTHDKAGVQFLDGPWRREGAGRHRAFDLDHSRVGGSVIHRPTVPT